MKLLETSVHKIETASELEKTIHGNENGMLCCSRMKPMYIPVYYAREELKDDREFKTKPAILTHEGTCLFVKHYKSI